jgi:hypothetical protein
LSPTDKDRVLKANQIYDNCFVLIELAVSRGFPVAIENPSRSWLWSIRCFDELLTRQFYDTEFQHCKWSDGIPSRNKWTRIRSNIPQMAMLSGPCCLSHVHLPWGLQKEKGFATADEAEYPLAMCEKISDVLVYHVASVGFATDTFKQHLLSPAPFKPLLSAKQPRGRRAPPLIPEFLHILSVSPETLRVTGISLFATLMMRVKQVASHPNFDWLAFFVIPCSTLKKRSRSFIHVTACQEFQSR